MEQETENHNLQEEIEKQEQLEKWNRESMEELRHDAEGMGYARTEPNFAITRAEVAMMLLDDYKRKIYRRQDVEKMKNMSEKEKSEYIRQLWHEGKYLYVSKNDEREYY